MNKLLTTLLGFVLLAILGYFCIYNNSIRIQNDIDTRTKAALVEQGIENVTVNTDGREVILVGEVANEAVRQQADVYAQQVYGVHTVTNQLTIYEPELVPASEPEVTELESEPKPATDEIIAAPKVESLPEFTCQEDFDALLRSNRILFANNSAEIDISSNALLNELIEIANQCPEAKIEIAGHTDSRGSDEYNLRLSQDRATSVMIYLINNGIEASRLSAVGYGETNPIADNDTAEGQEENRRIEFNVEGL